jgi:hypothetical protein
MPAGTDGGDSHFPHARILQLATYRVVLEYSGRHCNAKTVVRQADLQLFHRSGARLKTGRVLRHFVTFCQGKRGAPGRGLTVRTTECGSIRHNAALDRIHHDRPADGARLRRYSRNVLMMAVRAYSVLPFRTVLGDPARGSWLGGAFTADCRSSAT